MKTIDDNFTISVPTTCCYQHVQDNNNFKFVQFFVMKGLGCCIPVEDPIGHNFYASTFVHNTSLCVAVHDNGNVYVSNKQLNLGNLVAWGSHGVVQVGNNRSNAAQFRTEVVGDVAALENIIKEGVYPAACNDPSGGPRIHVDGGTRVAKGGVDSGGT